MKILPTWFNASLICLFLLVLCNNRSNAQSFQYRPTAYTQPFVSTVNSAAAARTYLGISASIGLGDTNVWTGTNTFTAANFYPANNIGVRLLWSSPTNIFIASMVASTALTNNGDYSATTPILSVTIPALMGSNSMLAVAYGASRTNANTTAGLLTYYVGPNTNFFFQSTVFGTTVGSVIAAPAPILVNAASYTSQFQGGGVVNISSVTNYVDTSAAFTLYLGAQTTTTHTNAHLIGFRVYELYSP